MRRRTRPWWPPASKKQAAHRPAAKKPAGAGTSRPAKTAPRSHPPEIHAKAVVIHRAPCLKPVADAVEEVIGGLRGAKGQSDGSTLARGGQAEDW